MDYRHVLCEQDCAWQGVDTMNTDDLELLLELLCDFNCTYALDSNEENAIDAAIDVVSKVLEDWQ